MSRSVFSIYDNIISLLIQLNRLYADAGQQLTVEDGQLRDALAAHTATLSMTRAMATARHHYGDAIVNGEEASREDALASSPHKSALSSVEVDRTPQPAEVFDHSPKGGPDYTQYYLIRKVVVGDDDDLYFSPVSDAAPPYQAYEYAKALNIARTRAENQDGTGHPIVVMTVTDVFMPPERPAVRHHRIRQP